MDENQTVDNEQGDMQETDELTILKGRAKLMGIKHSPNIGVDALAEKIEAAMKGETAKAETVTPSTDPAPVAPVVTKKNFRQQCIDDAMKLVRLRITNLDPKKKDLHGEIITVANEYIGTVRKMIPFGEATEDGFHVPNCIYQFMKERKFLQIKVRKVNGREQVQTTYVPEFALEVLPPITAVELERLRRAQLAAANQ